jgi:hypothetical protein
MRGANDAGPESARPLAHPASMRSVARFDAAGRALRCGRSRASMRPVARCRPARHATSRSELAISETEAHGGRADPKTPSLAHVLVSCPTQGDLETPLLCVLALQKPRRGCRRRGSNGRPSVPVASGLLDCRTHGFAPGCGSNRKPIVRSWVVLVVGGHWSWSRSVDPNSGTGLISIDEACVARHKQRPKGHADRTWIPVFPHENPRCAPPRTG